MYNVNHVLLEQELRNSPDEGEAMRASLANQIAKLRTQEGTLSQQVNAFWATSEDDKAAIEDLNRGMVPGWVIPNGVDTQMRPFDDRESKAASESVIFCGSLDYLPNRDALEWFHSEIWPLIKLNRPMTKLCIVGRGATDTDLASIRSDTSVKFVGEVVDVVPHYRNAGVCVVPLRLGSGTRLKILEAMSLGNPVVSTSLGAMGLHVTDKSDILLADDAHEFASNVLQLMNDRVRFDGMRELARNLVDARYDWRIIGKSAIHAIDTVISNGR
jgi:glycosyltransferase involved in cell wall biosynthesis